jgi:hypothetical protein
MSTCSILLRRASSLSLIGPSPSGLIVFVEEYRAIPSRSSAPPARADIDITAAWAQAQHGDHEASWA